MESEKNVSDNCGDIPSIFSDVHIKRCCIFMIFLNSRNLRCIFKPFRSQEKNPMRQLSF